VSRGEDEQIDKEVKARKADLARLKAEFNQATEERKERTFLRKRPWPTFFKRHRVRGAAAPRIS
jgi:hypothetical protein